MKVDVEKIFEYAYSSPKFITDEFNDVSYSMIGGAIMHLRLLGFCGCECAKKSHRTFVFGNHSHNPFRTLSINYDITWQGETINVDLSCAYPNFIEHADIIEPVRLYTKHPLTQQTIYAHMDKVWNYRPPEYLFQFLLRNYGWFVDNISSIITYYEQKEENPESRKPSFLRILKDASVSVECNREANGRLIASELIKDIFSTK